jgi:hypothetical protein
MSWIVFDVDARTSYGSFESRGQAEAHIARQAERENRSDTPNRNLVAVEVPE